jgi:hypothetical protein
MGVLIHQQETTKGEIMKVFHTPAIDGIYRPLLQKRLALIYADLEKRGQTKALEELSERGYTKQLTHNSYGEIDGYYTYQQDDL